MGRTMTMIGLERMNAEIMTKVFYVLGAVVLLIAIYCLAVGTRNWIHSIAVSRERRQLKAIEALEHDIQKEEYINELKRESYLERLENELKEVNN